MTVVTATVVSESLILWGIVIDAASIWLHYGFYNVKNRYVVVWLILRLQTFISNLVLYV